MKAITEKLLSHLSRFLGAEARLISEEMQEDGQILITWEKQLAPGDYRLAKDPPVLISPDGMTLRWQRSWCSKKPFTFKDLAESDPANEANRHPTTREIARRLEPSMRAANLMTPSGSAAVVVALNRHLWSQSAAALVASATGQDFWHLLNEIHRQWVDQSDPVGHFSAEEAEAAQTVIAEDWLMKAIREEGSEYFEHSLALPLVANPRFGLLGEKR